MLPVWGRQGAGSLATYQGLWLARMKCYLCGEDTGQAPWPRYIISWVSEVAMLVNVISANISLKIYCVWLICPRFNAMSPFWTIIYEMFMNPNRPSWATGMYGKISGNMVRLADVRFLTLRLRQQYFHYCLLKIGWHLGGSESVSWKQKA